jgi:hypothetical protein
MSAHDEERIKDLLRQALPPIEPEPTAGLEPRVDLWPAVLRRLDSRPAAMPWFDWTLAAGLIAFFAVFPASIPLLLYYL